MSNLVTPGYRAQRWFPGLLLASSGASKTSPMGTDLTPGQLRNTGQPYDLAMSGSGFFVVRSDDGQTFYTRNGQFARSDDGRLLLDGRLALQGEGGDLVLSAAAAPQILTDGTVLENGTPVEHVARAAIADPKSLTPYGASLFTAPDGAVATSNATVRQGMLESSNVSSADEMIAIMAALRNAETGQKLVQVYDDLMGRVLTAFGQS